MTDDPQFANLPLVASFIKTLGRVYLGPQVIIPAQNGDQVIGSADNLAASTESLDELIPVDTQRGMKEMLVGYFSSASKTLVKGQIVGGQALRRQETNFAFRNCWSRTSAITKRTSSQARSLKTVNTHMSA